MRELVGELEPKDQSVAKLLVRWFAQMPGETFSQAIGGINQRPYVEASHIQSPGSMIPFIFDTQGDGATSVT